MFRRQSPEARMQAEYAALTEDEKRQHRDELLSDLIEEFADKEQEDIEKDDPFREKTKKEKLKALAKRTAIKVGIGLLFGGATVAFGGVPVIAAAAALGSGLATSSLARGGVDAIRRFTGVEKAENQLQKNMSELHKRRQGELRRLARDVRSAEAGRLVENGQQISVEEARHRFMDYTVEISDQNSAENTQFKSDKEKLTKSKKKWRWIKFGASMASGILAGGAVAEAFRDELHQVASEHGFDMVGEGLGRVGDYAGIARDAGHHVHQNADGEVVFDYNPGELDAIHQTVADNPDQFGAIFESTQHARDLAAEGMHEAGGTVTEVFNQQVSEKVSGQVAELWGAVAADVAANELVDYLGQNDFAETEDARNDRMDISQANALNSEVRSDLSESAYRRLTGGAPEYPPIGGETSLQGPVDYNYLDQQNNTVTIRFNQGDRFVIEGVDRNDRIILRPVDNRQGQIPADLRIPLDIAAFDSSFLPPRQAQANPAPGGAQNPAVGPVPTGPGGPQTGLNPAGPQAPQPGAAGPGGPTPPAPGAPQPSQPGTGQQGSPGVAVTADPRPRILSVEDIDTTADEGLNLSDEREAQIRNWFENGMSQALQTGSEWYVIHEERRGVTAEGVNADGSKEQIMFPQYKNNRYEIVNVNWTGDIANSTIEFKPVQSNGKQYVSVIMNMRHFAFWSVPAFVEQLHDTHMSGYQFSPEYIYYQQHVLTWLEQNGSGSGAAVGENPRVADNEAIVRSQDRNERSTLLDNQQELEDEAARNINTTIGNQNQRVADHEAIIRRPEDNGIQSYSLLDNQEELENQAANEIAGADLSRIPTAEQQKGLPPIPESLEFFQFYGGEKNIRIEPGQRWSWKTRSGENEKYGKFSIEQIQKGNNPDYLRIKFTNDDEIRERPIEEWRAIFEAGKQLVYKENWDQYVFGNDENELTIAPEQTWRFKTDSSENGEMDKNSTYYIERIASSGEDGNLRIEFRDRPAKVRSAEEWQRIFETGQQIS